MAEQHSSKAHGHAEAATKLADALIESLNKTAERPAIHVPDGERPNKRSCNTATDCHGNAALNEEQSNKRDHENDDAKDKNGS
ncbi:hypothetical protein FDENT_2330 [Fusarium denticulatum]|uniref:Uncharacterized protein n=1 Tax=Fusarium denticulatum TaxID=48507 RepID=A0A8H5XGA3_9HYPO|nr:hypothetical protein FDENT_2330 [Fusarium denticulatum]